MKKALSLIMALALVFGLVLIAAPAAEAADHEHTNHDGWTAWNADNQSTIITSVNVDPANPDTMGNGLVSGKYYLTSDVCVKRLRIAVDADVTICLNGHKITSENYAQGMIDMAAGKTLTKLVICDCVGTGALERDTASLADTNGAGRQGCLLYLRANCQADIYGINFVAPTENPHAQASSLYTFADTSVLNIYDINSTPTPGAVDIFANKGVVNIFGLSSNLDVKHGASAVVNVAAGIQSADDAVNAAILHVIAPGNAPVEPPVTEPPVTEPPVTEPPATEPPATEPPVTEPSDAPTTKPAQTNKPSTEYVGEEQVPTDFTTIIIVVSVIVAGIVAIGVVNILKKDKKK